MKITITHIQEIDTRMITRIIRDQGAMNAIISSDNLDEKELIKKLKLFPSMEGLDLKKKFLQNQDILGIKIL